MAWKHIAALAALIFISLPAAAFDDGPTEQAPGMMFFVASRSTRATPKEQSLYSGLAIQGKRAYESVRVDSRMFNDDRTVNFFGTAIGVSGSSPARWRPAPWPRSRARTSPPAATTSSSSRPSSSQQAGGGGTGGGTFHPDGSPHVPGDSCDCHK